MSRHFVRWVWRPIQRIFKVSLNTPATDFEIRGKHDRAMYEWAAVRNDLILIAGHTHNPVFVSLPHLATLERIQDHLCARPDHQNAAEQVDREDPRPQDGNSLLRRLAVNEPPGRKGRQASHHRIISS